MKNSWRRLFLALPALLAANGCFVLGAFACRNQEEGPVTTLRGTIEPNAVSVHVVTMGNAGEFYHTGAPQWKDRGARGGPLIKFYATRSACTEFKAPPATNSGACEILSRADTTKWGNSRLGVGRIAGGDFGYMSTGYIPGSTRESRAATAWAQYKVWVVGDSTRTVTYSLPLTWKYGPDC
ncbi:MAG TPA: hypothetical protein VJR92_05190 [Gemmatimonadaceae bacterium]|nr:hypothetical protein [Gemmatimonadaceae bacterium]